MEVVVEKCDYLPQDMTRPLAIPADPVDAVLETMARLRVLERLLQCAVAAEITGDERHALLLRYNRQRQEIFDRLDGTAPARMLPTPAQLQELIAGPLTHDSADTTIANATANVRRMMSMLVIC